MPVVQQAPKDLVAVLVSDIHLSQKPPIARSAEGSWYQAMQRQLAELKRIAKGAPVLCAGDVFRPLVEFFGIGQFCPLAPASHVCCTRPARPAIPSSI